MNLFLFNTFKFICSIAFWLQYNRCLLCIVWRLGPNLELINSVQNRIECHKLYSYSSLHFSKEKKSQAPSFWSDSFLSWNLFDILVFTFSHSDLFSIEKKNVICWLLSLLDFFATENGHWTCNLSYNFFSLIRLHVCMFALYFDITRILLNNSDVNNKIKMSQFVIYIE